MQEIDDELVTNSVFWTTDKFEYTILDFSSTCNCIVVILCVYTLFHISLPTINATILWLFMGLTQNLVEGLLVYKVFMACKNTYCSDQFFHLTMVVLLTTWRSGNCWVLKHLCHCRLFQREFIMGNLWQSVNFRHLQMPIDLPLNDRYHWLASFQVQFVEASVGLCFIIWPCILQDREILMDTLTYQAVEEAIKKRVAMKARTYGQVVSANTEEDGGNPVYKIKPSLVANLYGKWIMPLTKEVQVEYLLRRLDWIKREISLAISDEIEILGRGEVIWRKSNFCQVVWNI